MFTEIPWNSRPISQPGCYVGVPMHAYHSQSICVDTSVSSSGLRRVLEENGGSPAHFYAESDINPNALEPEETDALILGRAVHHLLLGEKEFSAQFIIRPNQIPDENGVLRPWTGAGCSVKAREDWKARAQATGRTVLTIDMVEQIKGMALTLGLHPLVREGILSGRIERTIVWRDEVTGLWVKCRPDAIPTSSGDFADLKTTRSVQFQDVRRTIAEYAYHQQMALIREGAVRVLKVRPASFSLVFIEKKPPYCVRVVMLQDKDLALGEQQNRRALDLIASCIKAKHWPGPGDQEQASYVGLEDWYRARAKHMEKEDSAS